MNNKFFLDQIRDAKKVIVTPHALERGFDEQELESLATDLFGTLYIDTEEQTYHLLADDIVLVITVRNGKRIVLTAYPNDEPSRYHSIRFRRLRG